MSAKNTDHKNRWRNKIVAFRMSPEEATQLDTYVRLSGLTKQDYLIRRSLHTDIKVVGSPRVYKALRNQLKDVLEQLKRIRCGESVDSELLDVIRQIEVTMDGLKGEST